MNPSPAAYLAAYAHATRPRLPSGLWLAVTIHEHECGLLHRHGRYVARLDAGRHRRLGAGWELDVIDLRLREQVIAGQELLTKDRNPVKVSALLSSRIVDPLKHVRSAQEPETALYYAAQLALRDAVAGADLDALLDRTGDLDARVLAALAAPAAAIGYAVERLAVRDVMLAPELKRAYAEVIKARQEGLAALEKARAEHATLRTLANAARLMEEQPALAQLKSLQLLGEAMAKGGSTIVLGDHALPLRGATKAGGHAS